MSKGWIFLIAAAVTSLLNIKFCDLVFQCGCTWLWSGADLHCNVHNQHGRHCPFCAIDGAGNIVWGLMLLAQAVIVFSRTPWGWQKRLVAALLTFPLVGSIPALVLGLWVGYWS